MLQGELWSEVINLLRFHLLAADMFDFSLDPEDSIVLLQKSHKTKVSFSKDGQTP